MYPDKIYLWSKELLIHSSKFISRKKAPIRYFKKTIVRAPYLWWHGGFSLAPYLWWSGGFSVTLYLWWRGGFSLALYLWWLGGFYQSIMKSIVEKTLSFFCSVCVYSKGDLGMSLHILSNVYCSHALLMRNGIKPLVPNSLTLNFLCPVPATRWRVWYLDECSSACQGSYDQLVSRMN